MTPAEEVRAAADQLRKDDLPHLADVLDRIADGMFSADATVRRRLNGDGTGRIAVHPGGRPLGERHDWTAALAAARDINGSAS
jgi:hypothetical protein